MHYFSRPSGPRGGAAGFKKPSLPTGRGDTDLLPRGGSTGGKSFVSCRGVTPATARPPPWLSETSTGKLPRTFPRSRFSPNPRTSRSEITRNPLPESGSARPARRRALKLLDCKHLPCAGEPTLVHACPNLPAPRTEVRWRSGNALVR